MAGRWTKRIRMLGEDLVLYRDRSGGYGLLAEACPHRRASLAYGIPTADGIRCPYHGWQFDRAGRCTDQPNEPTDSNFKDKVRTAGYPVQELSGVLFAYLGPEPVPLLPRLDGFVTDGPAIRMYGQTRVPCNWLQIMENSLDPVHAEWLHGHLAEFVEEQRGGARFSHSRKHLKIAFAEFEYGIYKRRLLRGAREDSDDWRVGHPVFFPNILAVGSGGGELWKMNAYQIRIPQDDEHTLHVWYDVFIPPPGVTVPQHLLDRVVVYDIPAVDASGEYNLDLLDAQDVMAWETQGPIADRSAERLGTTDAGIIQFRGMLRRELAKVEAGEDPIGVLRDPAKNERITYAVEKNKVHFADGFESYAARVHNRYYPYVADLARVFEQNARPIAAAYGE
jgi:5,5'-dehydrodivanillate O-demethylase